MYAKACAEAACADEETMNKFEFSYALVHPSLKDVDKRYGAIAIEKESNIGYIWSFPQDLNEASIKLANRYSKAEGIAKFASLQPDLVLPNMYCYSGLTQFRNLCELLDFEVVGPGSYTQEISENKAWSKAIFQSAGVPVARGERLLLGENESPTCITLPFVVKPCCEGNSVAVSLCSAESEVQAALEEAFTYDNEVLVEQFIPLGRELRVACIEESDSSITILPVLEYFSVPQIRKMKDKFRVCDKIKEVEGWTQAKTQVPADVDDELKSKLKLFATKAFKAINCRDFCLFDIRVDPGGNPFFLEASSYCSFAPLAPFSLIATSVIDHQTLFRKVLLNAANRGLCRKNAAKQSNGLQKSMKGKLLVPKND